MGLVTFSNECVPALKHIVMFSGGLGSWAAAKRVAAQHGTSDMTLLFTDTRMEDKDLYRFLTEGALNVGAPLVRIAEGRNPWHVFFDGRFLGNSRVDPCSRILKREMAEKWLIEHCDPSETIVYVGIGWSEEHRYTAMKARHAAKGWRYEAPMIEAPYLDNHQVAAWLEREGIKVPRLYGMGFAHNNCGGFCVKAGQGHFRVLLDQLPKEYAEHEALEQAFRTYIGKDVAIMTDRTGGTRKPLTLKDFRIRVESGAQVDAFDIGGCGCFVTEGEAA